MLIGIVGTPNSGKSILRKVFEEMGYQSLILNCGDCFSEHIVPQINDSTNQIIDSFHKVDDIEKFLFSHKGTLIHVDFNPCDSYTIQDKYLRWAKKNKFDYESRENYSKFLEMNKYYSRLSGLSGVKINNVFDFFEMKKIGDIKGFKLGGYDLGKIIHLVTKR